MTSRKKTPYKRKVSVLAGLEALNSFKVPKKQNKLSLLENIGLNSVDYLEEIYPQINQSFRFPQLSPHFEVEEAWLIHNKTLEDSFSQARKRLQKNPITNAITGTESSLCTGFLAVKDWKDVENIAADGLGPGNDPDTWLGQPKLGLSVNQCADLTVAREQSRFLSKDIDQFLYLIMVRWVKSRAYIVSPEAQNSKDRLEPQPGYACHVSTWSRMDLLDPSKLTLEQIFHLSQVYLYEFDEDLELRTKLDHVVPYAVLKCRWRLTSEVASKLDPLSAASGSILIISPQQPDITCLRSTTRTALLPTPQIPRIHKTSSRRQLKTSSTSDFESKLKPKNRRSNVTRGKNPYRYVTTGLLSSPASSTGLLPSPPAINSTTVGIDENSEQLTSPNQQFKQQTTGFLNLLIAHARRLQASCELFEFSECSKINNNSSNASVNDNISSNSLTSFNAVTGELPSTLIGISLLTWGYPKPEYSLAVEISTFRKGQMVVFDGILQPCLHIQRLVSHASLHYELAGLRPWTSKPFDVNGPPVLVSVPRDQEWCLPRLNPIKASSLQSDPSPFGGYRGNYFRLTLHESGGHRTEMAQLCQALQDSEMAGVVSMPCDESSIMFLFPESQFSRSIGLPTADTLDTNILHAILLTPHNLNRYPYSEMCCWSDDYKSTFNQLPFADAGAPIGATSDALFGQRKTSSLYVSSMQLKLPLNRILTTLADSGRNLLGSALISILSHQNSSENSSPNKEATNSITMSSASDPRLHPNAHLDPRLRHRQVYTDEPDWYALATALISSKPQKKTENFKSEQLKPEENQTLEIPPVTNSICPETHDSKAVIPAPSSPEVESKYDLITLMNPVNIPKEIPLDGQIFSTATPNPLSTSSPSNLVALANSPICQNVSVDMEIENDRSEVSSRLDKSDMDIDNSFDANNRLLTLRFSKPPPIPPKTIDWIRPSQLSVLISDFRKASSPSRRSSLPIDDSSTSTSRSSKSVARRPGKLTGYSDSRYTSKHRDHERHRRSRSPGYHKSKPISYRRRYRSPSDSKYDSNERRKSVYRNQRSRGRCRSKRIRNPDKYAPHRRYEDSPYKYPRTRGRSPSYADSDNRYHRHRSHSSDSSSVTGTDSNSFTPIKNRRGYYSNLKKKETSPFNSQSEFTRRPTCRAEFRKSTDSEARTEYARQNNNIHQNPITCESYGRSSKSDNKIINSINVNDRITSLDNNEVVKSQNSAIDYNESNKITSSPASNTRGDALAIIPKSIQSNKFIDESEEGEVLDDEGDDVDDANEEIQNNRNTHNNVSYISLSDSSISHSNEKRQGTPYRKIDTDGGSLRHHDSVTANQKMSKPHKDADEEEEEDDLSVDRTSFQSLQVGCIFKHMSKHGNVESEPVPDSRRHMNSSIGSSQSASRSEDEYKLIDETFSSTERSDCSVVDNETFLKDEDMRQNGRYTKHYGNFYQPTVYHSMARRQLKNPNDDSLSDHDDRISGSHKEDIDYRRPPAQWSSGHHRPSLLGNYVDPSTPSCSETQPKYSFYRPKRSYSNLPKTSHKAVYSPRSSSSIPDEDRIFSPRARDAGSSFIPSHQISPENCPETPSRFRNKSRDQPLLGNPNLPLIPHVNSNTPNIPGPGLLPMTAGYNVQPLYVVPSVNLWSLTHNFYSQTVNLFSQPEKPWQ